MTQAQVKKKAKNKVSEPSSKHFWEDRNIIAWVVFFLFLYAEWANYENVKEIQKICDLLGEHNMWNGHPTTPRQKIDNICIEHDPNNDPPPDN
jgi:hypothetical protein